MNRFFKRPKLKEHLSDYFTRSTFKINWKHLTLLVIGIASVFCLCLNSLAKIYSCSSYHPETLGCTNWAGEIQNNEDKTKQQNKHANIDVKALYHHC